MSHCRSFPIFSSSPSLSPSLCQVWSSLSPPTSQDFPPPPPSPSPPPALSPHLRVHIPSAGWHFLFWRVKCLSDVWNNKRHTNRKPNQFCIPSETIIHQRFETHSLFICLSILKIKSNNNNQIPCQLEQIPFSFFFFFSFFFTTIF